MLGLNFHRSFKLIWLKCQRKDNGVSNQIVTKGIIVPNLNLTGPQHWQ